ncbi:bifunctional indole-3-glycerol-phosphate synthase TrpC/phosphoribosylanthranilate isomerase TrpF [Aeromonas hydrophila]|uniref:bifunctional indole-3-glycerol-phosphate synthase TrpC/phosphoribosylanthranilate isomerase TrpF n=1 Tax=Aeromonas hydrophila TaxID=644 RepID=UPI001A27FB51|nr:bifunctional indole-3-glycerol-phosphate synthase TrpC/phosphoribosylanthranilate isomerase TrpF [Aeromonas hydrophila]EHA1066649.1 bifunctional indole-3-glycerol-phosphate synthase TrpC/phosphoribosylanthranilate isomerase TrpF [Aeromonas hydrophila]MDD9228616.1 bifunctional indole-3-glycerol-phosphate synthase TrpC/phosphoribosylanthranilate isomerase TrpF [Aeromonas hydrophila]HAT1553255.1 bifunctional indole-3-glycerol-phosphate synthase TrpC/phosphoribosylanthranilate isomerase TrpF [Aer
MSATTLHSSHSERPQGKSQFRKDNDMSDLIAPHAFLNMASISQTILGKIVAAKQEWVAARKLAQPLESFQSALTPSDRDFVGALKAGSTRFILECKKASPSKGLIRDDFSPEAIADIYGKYATAISVLTDEKFFQGDFAFLPRVRGRVQQPVLCKDFMIDPYQVYLARHYQADAILLMLSVLTDEGYRALFAVAKALGLGVLTEVSNEEELARAIALGAPVIGINNRDLRDLSVDLARTKQLAAILSQKAPADRVVISESGINHRAQVADLRHHAKGFLVGSSLMAEPDLEAAVRKLVLGQNKVCGLTRAEDAAAAHQAGAVFGGLIFVAKSPRYVDIPAARAVMAGAPLSYVGVFRNAQPATIVKTVEALGLAAVQLHGDEDAAYIEELRPLLPTGCQIWKAVGVSLGKESGEPLPALDYQVDRLLLDTKVGSQSGGTGQAFDWAMLANLDKAKLMLAGGLNPDNALQAAQVGCLGLDFNSGVESAPGQKDAHKLAAAFAALRTL